MQVKQGLQGKIQPQIKMKKSKKPQIQIPLPVMIRYNLTIQHKQDETFFEVASFATLNKARQARNTFIKSFDSKIEVQVLTNQGWQDKANLTSQLESCFA